MSTRGFLGIRNKKELLKGVFNHWDSYYDNLGLEVLGLYFKGEGDKIPSLSPEQDEDKEFIHDGLFCEYAYVYNSEDDTLEIYRGFFKTKQSGNIKEKIVEVLEQGRDKYYCHLIMIIDKKKHKIENVKRAFKEYDKREDEGKESEGDYPEREIIPLELPKDYVYVV